MASLVKSKVMGSTEPKFKPLKESQVEDNPSIPKVNPQKDFKDYFRKAGLRPPEDDEIIVTQGANNDSRRVRIAVSEQLPTWFMNMMGVKSLSASKGTLPRTCGAMALLLAWPASSV